MKRYYWRPHDDCDDVEPLGEFASDEAATLYLERSGAPLGVAFWFEVRLEGRLVQVVDAAGRVH